MSNLISYLFKTDSVKICPENNPFWLTSGRISPYYINTHFLYGSESDAVNLLKFIDDELSNKNEMPRKVYEATMKQYEENEIFKNVIDTMVDFIKTNINVSEIDYISGGERRDWFFSYVIAKLLDKPHISIYKDLETVITDMNGNVISNNDSSSTKNVLHIADLITEASSYVRAWIPAIENLGAKIKWSLVVVDRMQGGAEKLKEHDIKSFSLVNIDNSLFLTALEMGIINEVQCKMLSNFFANPDETMKNFIKSHPEFLENALASDEKTASRARLCIEQKFYE